MLVLIAAAVVSAIVHLYRYRNLMLPRDRFIAGLVSFLLAHVVYIFAFTDGLPFFASPSTASACASAPHRRW